MNGGWGSWQLRDKVQFTREREREREQMGGSGRAAGGSMAHTEMQSENEDLHTTALGTMYDPDVVYVLPLTRTFPLSLSEPISFWPARLFTNLFCAQYETRKMHEATGCLPAPFPPTRPPPIAQCPPSGQKSPMRCKRTQ